MPQLLRFVAHPLRRKLLVAMARGDLTAAELSRKIHAPLKTVRYHLAVMEARSVAKVNRRIKPNRYRLTNIVQVVFFEHKAVIAIRPSPDQEITLKIPHARRSS